MKKAFLLFFALSTFGLTNAQKNASHIGIKNMARIDLNQTNIPNKPISLPSSKAASSIDLGSSYNIFTILADRQNQVAYNSDINTITFVHRQNDGGPGTSATASGIMSLDYSTDGGATWTVNPFQTTPTGSGGTWSGNRYPNIGIYNPTSNTDPANAYVIQVGPALEDGVNSNDIGWAKTFRSTFQLNQSNLEETYDHNSISSIGDPNEWGAAGLYVTSQGTAWYVSTNINNSGETPLVVYDQADNYSNYFIVRGDYNSNNNNFDWTVTDTITPNWTTTVNGSSTSYPCGGLANMAWSPDGNVGYIVIMGIWGSNNSMFRPYVMKTTDAGANWSQYTDFDFSTDPQIQCMIVPGSSGEQRPFFGFYDIVVDNNGNLRIFTEISSGSSSHPDSLLYAYEYHGYGHLWEVATNNSNGWDITFIDSIYVSNYQWDATNQLEHFVRPQAARSKDGSKVFYTWSHTNPTFAAGQRQFPGINAIGHDISSGKWTHITDLTTPVDLYFAAYPTMSVDVIENGSEKNYELPIVYGTDINGALLTNGLTPPRWHYFRGAGFDDSDFTIKTAQSACSIANSITERKLNTQDVLIFPNPTNGIVQIKIANSEEFSYTIVDVIGNAIETKVVNDNQTTIDLTNNTKGIYFIAINSDKGSITKKVMLTK